MAAFIVSPIFGPGAGWRRAWVFATLRVDRRRSIRLAVTATWVATATAEILLCLWTALALAFSLLVVAGFFA